MRRMILRRAVIPRGWVALFHAEDPLLPVLGLANSVEAVRADNKLDVKGTRANEADDLGVLRELLDSIEVLQDAQEDESLRVHVFPQEHIFAEIVHREVVLPESVSTALPLLKC